MRIVEIEVEQLFGTFDHRVPLNIGDRITLIHGPNGFGKTILLEMLYGLFNGRYATLRRIPFRQLIARFDDGLRLTVTKGDLAEQLDLLEAEPVLEPALLQPLAESEREIQIALNDGAFGHDNEHEFKLGSMHSEEIVRHISRAVPHLERVGPSTWLDLTTDEVLTADEVLETYGDHFLGRQRTLFGDQLALFSQDEPEWWQRIRRSFRVEMIREQRLMQLRPARTRRGAPAMVPAIYDYSNELARKLKEKLAESAALSQSLDRTFPARLLERIHAAGPSENALSAKLAELERKREQLRDAGLLDEQEAMPLLPTERLGEETRDVLAVYVEDAEKKLGIFEDLALKIELFQEIINSRFLYKRLSISRKDGFVFTTSRGEFLPLNALSSGEQQELVLLYELLFRLDPDSLVLIDEPEISLHVAWQKKFLEDLTKITELTSFDVLIATHSPQIIHKRWDLTVELASPKVEAEVAAIP